MESPVLPRLGDDIVGERGEAGVEVPDSRPMVDQLMELWDTDVWYSSLRESV